MILRSLHIDGFGVHRDLAWELRPGLNLVLGPNEAGKTTIHAFIRGMLHGFPDGRSKETKHPPLQGGSHGGRLEVEAVDGLVYRITRGGPGRGSVHVERVGGASGGQELIDPLLGKTDAQLFRNVFAFGLDELADFGGLTGSEMERRIFDAALAGAGRSVSSLVDDLKKAKEEELTPRKGRLREAAHRLEQLEQELRSAKARVKSYGPLVEEELRGVEALGEAKDRARRARAEAAKWEALRSLWPVELRRRDAIARLTALPTAAALVADASVAGASVAAGALLARFDAAAEKLVEWEGAQERDEGERQRLGQEIAAIPPDPSLTSIAGRALALEQEARLVEDHRLRIPVLTSAIEQREAEVQGLLAGLGAGWDESRVRTIDRSLPRREAIDGYASRFRDWERREALASANLERARDDHRKVVDEIEDRREVLKGMEEPPTAEALELRGGALAELRGAREDREHTIRRLQTIRDQGLAMSHRDAGGSGGGPLPWIVAGIFIAAAVAALVRGESVGAAIAAAAGVAMLVVGRLARGGRGRQSDGRSLGSEGAESGVEEDLRTIEAALRVHAEAVGLAEEPTAAAVEVASGALQRDRERRHRWDELGRELARQERLRISAEDGVETAQAAAGALAEGARALESSWTVEIADLLDGGREPGARHGGKEPEALHGDGDSQPILRPEAARERLQRIDEVIEALDQSGRDEQERDRLVAALRGWEAAVRALAALAGIEGEGREALARIADRAAQERARAEDRRLLEAQLRKMEVDRERLEAERRRLEAERDGLLIEAGVSSREELASLVDVERRRGEALEELRGAERAIEERLGDGEEARVARAELATGEKVRWEEAVEEASADEEEAGAAVEELTRQLAIQRREREDLEVSADVHRIASAIEEHRAEIAAAAERWRMAALLERLLQVSLEDMRRDRQPAVLRHAGEAFERITGGRYSAILQTMEGDGVEVLDRRGQRLAAGALSRGTREQLYVCVRLGLAAAFAEQGTRLPLLMDDVMANFDPERATATAAVLADHGREHQLIVFTCHPATVERLLAAEPSAGLLELGACEKTALMQGGGGFFTRAARYGSF